jgi:hypothetical protein
MKKRSKTDNGILGAGSARRCLTAMLPLMILVSTAFGQVMNTSTVYVGGSVPQWGSNPDIGAQIDAAYSSCPATGCIIILVPQASGACYDYNVPISFGTVGKYALLQGGGPTAEGLATIMNGVVIAGPSGGACLNFTPTSAVSAITFDYASFLGGGYATAHGVRDLILQNNKCKELGGCNSQAIGIQLGGTNSGAQTGDIANVRVNGFGTGIKFVEGGSESWGMVLRNDSIVENTTGISFFGNLENISLFGGRVAGNGVGLSLIGNADVYAHGVSIDSNLTTGIKAASGLFSCTNCHFENLAGASVSILPHYFIGTGAASLVIEGGKAIDNAPSGSDVDYWFSNAGISTYIHGLLIYSPGRKATQVVQSISPCTWWISIFNDSPTTLPTITMGPSQLGTLFTNGLFSPSTSVQSQFLIPGLGTAFAPGNVALSPGWGTGSSVDFSFGTSQRFSFVVHSEGAGQTAGPVMHITFPTPWPATPFYVCKMVGGTGPVTPVYGEANANTTNMALTFVGTPAVGSSYQIQCVGE